MRDPARIDRILELLRIFWKMPGNEDVRLGQIVGNFSGRRPEYFYEDSDLERTLEDAIAGRSPPDSFYLHGNSPVVWLFLKGGQLGCLRYSYVVLPK